MKNLKVSLNCMIITLGAWMLITSCHKNKHESPNMATAKITNIDGNNIQFSSSSGSTATLIDTLGDGTSDEFVLHLEDSKVKTTIDIITLPMTGPTTINLNGKGGMNDWNYATINISSNPPGKQDFCTCGDLTYDGTPDGGGTLTITSISSNRIKGTLNNMSFLQHNFLVKTVKLTDGKFDLKLVRK